jgi:hypothetical protein
MSNNGRRIRRSTTMSGLISERDFEPVVSAFRELHDCFSVQRSPIVALCDAQTKEFHKFSFTSENEVNSIIFILSDG